jgi:hypothetical protein
MGELFRRLAFGCCPGVDNALYRYSTALLRYAKLSGHVAVGGPQLDSPCTVHALIDNGPVLAYEIAPSLFHDLRLINHTFRTFT